MPRVNCVEVSVSVGNTSERAGSNNTSSKVSPSEIFSVIMVRYFTPLILTPQKNKCPRTRAGGSKQFAKTEGVTFASAAVRRTAVMGSIAGSEKTYTKNARWPSLLGAVLSSRLTAERGSALRVSDLFGLNLV